ncbi:MAG: flagellin [Candidatus Latescibacterota bacterium]
MGIYLDTNAPALRATNHLSRVYRDSEVRRTRLASGLAVNSARDGGARLSVSEGMRAEIGGLTQGTRNAEHALDLLRTAEGAMSEMSGALIRMRELAVESSTATLNDRNRLSLEAEFNQLKDFIDRTARLVAYNDQPLLSGFGNTVASALSTALAQASTTGVEQVQVSGASSGTYVFVDAGEDALLTLGNGVVTQTVALGSRLVGDHVAAGTTLAVSFDRLGVELVLAGEGASAAAGAYADGDLDGRTLVVESGTGGSFQLGSDAVPADRLEYDLKDLTVDGGVLNLAPVSVASRDSARMALAQVDAAVQRLARERGEAGAVINRLEYTIDHAAGALEGLHASESTVRDTDYAWETSHLARNQIVAQASMAALIQSRVPVTTLMGLLQ